MLQKKNRPADSLTGVVAVQAEASEVLKVTVSVAGLLGARESFFG